MVDAHLAGLFALCKLQIANCKLEGIIVEVIIATPSRFSTPAMYLSVTLGLSVGLSLYYGSYRHATLLISELALAEPAPLDELVAGDSAEICPPPPKIDSDYDQAELESQIEELRDDAIGAYIEQEQLRSRARTFVEKVEELTKEREGAQQEKNQTQPEITYGGDVVAIAPSGVEDLFSSCVSIEDIEERIGELFTIDENDVGKPAGWEVNREDGLWIGDEILMASLRQHVEEVKDEEKVKVRATTRQ